MPTVQEIIDRAEILAGGLTGDSSHSPLVDSEVTAFTVYPHAVRFAIRQAIKRGDAVENIARDIAIELQDGTGALPDDVLREYVAQAYLPSEVNKLTSWVPYSDYRRYRYDNQMCYFAFRDGQMFYSCEPGLLDEGELATIHTTLGSASVGTSGIIWLGSSGGFYPVAGKRVRFVSAAGVVLIDAFVDYADDADTLVFNGRPLAAYNAAGTYKVYDDGPYVVSRALTSVGTTADSATVTCAGGAFTSADIGRRLRVETSGGGSVIVDAVIASVTNSTTVVLNAKATASGSTGEGDVMYSPVDLNIPAMPEMPSNPATSVDLSAKVVEDVVVTIAAVLRGEYPLPRLIEDAKPKT